MTWRFDFALAAITVATCSCASNRPPSWSEVGGYDKKAPETAQRDPVKEARDAFSDDACMSIAEAELEKNAELAHELGLECIKRDDFMLVRRFSDAKWKGFKVPMMQWDSLMRGAVRGGSPDAVDLTPVGIEAGSLVDVEDAEKSDYYLVVGIAVGTRHKGKSGVLLRPIVYEGGQFTKRAEGKYDIVGKGGEVLESGVTMVREKKYGSTRASTILEDIYFINASSSSKFKKGERYVILVDSVELVNSNSEKEPVLRARYVAYSPFNPDTGAQSESN